MCHYGLVIIVIKPFIIHLKISIKVTVRHASSLSLSLSLYFFYFSHFLSSLSLPLSIRTKEARRIQGKSVFISDGQQREKRAKEKRLSSDFERIQHQEQEKGTDTETGQ